MPDGGITAQAERKQLTRSKPNTFIFKMILCDSCSKLASNLHVAHVRIEWSII